MTTPMPHWSPPCLPSTNSWNPPHDVQIPLPSTPFGLRSRIRLSRRLHGHRPRPPDPPRPRRGPEGDAEPGLAVVHELLRDDRRVDADHRLVLVALRRPPHAARRALAGRALQRA